MLIPGAWESWLEIQVCRPAGWYKEIESREDLLRKESVVVLNTDEYAIREKCLFLLCLTEPSSEHIDVAPLFFAELGKETSLLRKLLMSMFGEKESTLSNRRNEVFVRWEILTEAALQEKAGELACMFLVYRIKEEERKKEERKKEEAPRRRSRKNKPAQWWRSEMYRTRDLFFGNKELVDGTTGTMLSSVWKPEKIEKRGRFRRERENRKGEIEIDSSVESVIGVRQGIRGFDLSILRRGLSKLCDTCVKKSFRLRFEVGSNPIECCKECSSKFRPESPDDMVFVHFLESAPAIAEASKKIDSILAKRIEEIFRRSRKSTWKG